MLKFLKFFIGLLLVKSTYQKVVIKSIYLTFNCLQDKNSSEQTF